MEFPRQEYWSWLSFPAPGYLPNAGIEPMPPAMAGGFLFLTTEPLRSPCMCIPDQMCVHTYTESGRSAGLILHPQLHNVLFSHFHNISHFTTQGHTMQDTGHPLTNGAPNGFCHLFGWLNAPGTKPSALHTSSCLVTQQPLKKALWWGNWGLWKITCSHTPGMGQLVHQTKMPGLFNNRHPHPTPPACHGGRNSDSRWCTESQATETYVSFLLKVRR